jgi:hypothetical protein
MSDISIYYAENSKVKRTPPALHRRLTAMRLKWAAGRTAEIGVSSYFTMWSMLTIMAVGAAADPLVHGNALGAIRAAYPSDPTKSDALHRCAQIDRDFSRFSEHERELCYQAVIRETQQASSNATTWRPIPPPHITPQPPAGR